MSTAYLLYDLIHEIGNFLLAGVIVEHDWSMGAAMKVMTEQGSSWSPR